jgi:putative FmdB family regulatory protein
MPQYTFDCRCGLQFTRTLKAENHESCVCPDCGEDAPRQLIGQSFGFGFSPGSTPGNSGVTKHDSPTADQVVGRSAEVRWREYEERETVKDKVREIGGTRALRRRTYRDAIEYEEGGDAIERRKKIVNRIRQFERSDD